MTADLTPSNADGNAGTASRTPIRVGIVGPTGYTGLYLIDLLLRHPAARVCYLASHRETLPDIREEFPQLSGRLDDAVARCRPIDADALASACEAVFLALPHKAAMAVAPGLLDRGLTVIDLSADYRLADVSLYERVYDTPHADADRLASAVYGLPELFREDLHALRDGSDPATGRLIANPGCYPTAAALAIAPLMRAGLIDPTTIVVNAASGVSGAGRSAKPATHFPEHNESYYAYGVIGGHRHQPEIAQTLSRLGGAGRGEITIEPLFVPHLLPVDAGILATVYAEPLAGRPLDPGRIDDAYRAMYGSEPFVRLRDRPPNIKHVRGTNFCDVHAVPATVAGRQRIVAFAAEDNMVKGASGQAIQNLNAVFGLPETLGLL